MPRQWLLHYRRTRTKQRFESLFRTTMSGDELIINANVEWRAKEVSKEVSVLTFSRRLSSSSNNRRTLLLVISAFP